MAGKGLLIGTVFEQIPVPGTPGPLDVLSSFNEYPWNADEDFTGQDDGSSISHGISDQLWSQTDTSVNGVDYLVIYRGQGGVTTQPPPNQQETTVRCKMGSTTLAEGVANLAGHVGSSAQEHWHGGQIRGFTVVQGDGSRFTIEGDIGNDGGSSDTYNFGACAVIAIPLGSTGGGQGDPNELHDYFANVDNSGSETEITTVNSGLPGAGAPSTNETDRTLRRSFPDGVASAQTMHSLTIRAPDAGDYLVMYSCELKTSNTSTTQKCIFMYGTCDDDAVGGGSGQDIPINKVHDTRRGTDYTPDRNEWHSAMHCELLTLSEGLHTLDIRCLASDVGTSGEDRFLFRRGRIIVLRADSWTGMTQSQVSTKIPNIDGTSGGAVEDPIAFFYTTANNFTTMPNNNEGQTLDQITIGNIMIRGGESTTLGGVSPGGGLAKLRQTSNSIDFNDQAGSWVHRTRPWRGGHGYFNTLLCGLYAVSNGSSVNWASQFIRSQSGFGGVYIGRATETRNSPDEEPPFHSLNTSGTLTSAGNTGGSVNGNAFMIDTGASFGTLTGSSVEGWLTITSGAGAGQGRRILVNDSTEIEFQDSWETIPSPGDSYEVHTGTIPVGDSLGMTNQDLNTNLIGWYAHITGV